MAYIANHMIRYNGTLYQKGDEVPLKFGEAQELLKHRAVSKVGRTDEAKAAEAPAAKAAPEAEAINAKPAPAAQTKAEPAKTTAAKKAPAQG